VRIGDITRLPVQCVTLLQVWHVKGPSIIGDQDHVAGEVFPRGLECRKLLLHAPHKILRGDEAVILQKGEADENDRPLVDPEGFQVEEEEPLRIIEPVRAE